MMSLVGLKVEHLRRYPHSFSGGQRQRIGIARALVLHPKLIVADEPVSALDVSIQAQTLNLLRDLQKELGLTYLFISHDLGVVRYMSDRIAVMYMGRLVELAPKDELLSHPLHPYTETLLSAIPRADLAYKKHRIIPRGELPDPTKLPSGCVFHPRCMYAKDRCRQEVPRLREVAPGRFASCHFAGELPLAGV
jgi:oligopeptide/dipeptide ABC transporter ATP-binding protein